MHSLHVVPSAFPAPGKFPVSLWRRKISPTVFLDRYGHHISIELHEKIPQWQTLLKSFRCNEVPDCAGFRMETNLLWSVYMWNRSGLRSRYFNTSPLTFIDAYYFSAVDQYKNDPLKVSDWKSNSWCLCVWKGRFKSSHRTFIKGAEQLLSLASVSWQKVALASGCKRRTNIANVDIVPLKESVRFCSTRPHEIYIFDCTFGSLLNLTVERL